MDPEQMLLALIADCDATKAAHMSDEDLMKELRAANKRAAALNFEYARREAKRHRDFENMINRALTDQYSRPISDTSVQ